MYQTSEAAENASASASTQRFPSSRKYLWDRTLQAPMLYLQPTAFLPTVEASPDILPAALAALRAAPSSKGSGASASQRQHANDAAPGPQPAMLMLQGRLSVQPDGSHCRLLLEPATPGLMAHTNPGPLELQVPCTILQQPPTSTSTSTAPATLGVPPHPPPDAGKLRHALGSRLSARGAAGYAQLLASSCSLVLTPSSTNLSSTTSGGSSGGYGPPGGAGGSACMGHLRGCLMVAGGVLALGRLACKRVADGALARALAGAMPPGAGTEDGYLTMDASRSLVPLHALDSQVFSVPLVGVWLRGVPGPQHPLVLAACLRFACSATLPDRALNEAGAFLLLMYPPGGCVAPDCYEVCLQDPHQRPPLSHLSTNASLPAATAASQRAASQGPPLLRYTYQGELLQLQDNGGGGGGAGGGGGWGSGALGPPQRVGQPARLVVQPDGADVEAMYLHSPGNARATTATPLHPPPTSSTRHGSATTAPPTRPTATSPSPAQPPSTNTYPHHHQQQHQYRQPLPTATPHNGATAMTTTQAHDLAPALHASVRQLSSEAARDAYLHLSSAASAAASTATTAYGTTTHGMTGHSTHSTSTYGATTMTAQTYRDGGGGGGGGGVDGVPSDSPPPVPRPLDPRGTFRPAPQPPQPQAHASAGEGRGMRQPPQQQQPWQADGAVNRVGHGHGDGDGDGTHGTGLAVPPPAQAQSSSDRRSLDVWLQQQQQQRWSQQQQPQQPHDPRRAPQHPPGSDAAATTVRDSRSLPSQATQQQQQQHPSAAAKAAGVGGTGGGQAWDSQQWANPPLPGLERSTSPDLPGHHPRDAADPDTSADPNIACMDRGDDTRIQPHELSHPHAYGGVWQQQGNAYPNSAHAASGKADAGGGRDRVEDYSRAHGGYTTLPPPHGQPAQQPSIPHSQATAARPTTLASSGNGNAAAGSGSSSSAVHMMAAAAPPPARTLTLPPPTTTTMTTLRPLYNPLLHSRSSSLTMTTTAAAASAHHHPPPAGHPPHPHPPRPNHLPTATSAAPAAHATFATQPTSLTPLETRTDAAVGAAVAAAAQRQWAISSSVNNSLAATGPLLPHGTAWSSTHHHHPHAPAAPPGGQLSQPHVASQQFPPSAAVAAAAHSSMAMEAACGGAAAGHHHHEVVVVAPGGQGQLAAGDAQVLTQQVMVLQQQVMVLQQQLSLLLSAGGLPTQHQAPAPLPPPHHTHAPPPHAGSTLPTQHATAPPTTSTTAAASFHPQHSYPHEPPQQQHVHGSSSASFAAHLQQQVANQAASAADGSGPTVEQAMDAQQQHVRPPPSHLQQQHTQQHTQQQQNQHQQPGEDLGVGGSCFQVQQPSSNDSSPLLTADGTRSTACPSSACVPSTVRQAAAARAWQQHDTPDSPGGVAAAALLQRQQDKGQRLQGGFGGEDAGEGLSGQGGEAREEEEGERGEGRGRTGAWLAAQRAQQQGLQSGHSTPATAVVSRRELFGSSCSSSVCGSADRGQELRVGQASGGSVRERLSQRLTQLDSDAAASVLEAEASSSRSHGQHHHDAGGGDLGPQWRPSSISASGWQHAPDVDAVSATLQQQQRQQQEDVRSAQPVPEATAYGGGAQVQSARPGTAGSVASESRAPAPAAIVAVGNPPVASRAGSGAGSAVAGRGAGSSLASGLSAFSSSRGGARSSSAEEAQGDDTSSLSSGSDDDDGLRRKQRRSRRAKGGLSSTPAPPAAALASAATPGALLRTRHVPLEEEEESEASDDEFEAQLMRKYGLAR